MTAVLALIILLFFLFYNKFLSPTNINVFACGMITENEIDPRIAPCAFHVSFRYKNKPYSLSTEFLLSF
jgi:hypothetical protein